MKSNNFGIVEWLVPPSKPDHFLFGGKWHIKDLPDPRETLGNNSLLCAISASTAEHMVELFNWRFGLGIRRDCQWGSQIRILRHVRWRAWCKDQCGSPKRGVYMARNMLEFETLSPSFKKRNRLAISQFMYFLWLQSMRMNYGCTIFYDSFPQETTLNLVLPMSFSESSNSLVRWGTSHVEDELSRLIRRKILLSVL